MRRVILEMVLSKDKFPVNFDYFWHWTGYASKQNAKKKLFKLFKLGRDYIIEPFQGANVNVLFLTTACFKSLAISSQTVEGNEVWGIFEEYESIPKKEAGVSSLLAQEPQQSLFSDEVEQLFQQWSESLTNINLAFSLLQEPLIATRHDLYQKILLVECSSTISYLERLRFHLLTELIAHKRAKSRDLQCTSKSAAALMTAA